MQKYKKEWVVSLGLLLLAAAAGFVFGSYPAAAPADAKPIVPGDVAWMLTATALVLLMTPGLSFFYGGMVQRKNVISTMLQSFIAIGAIASLVSNLAVHRKARTNLDDTLDVFPCHGVGGIVGMIATGALADKVGLDVSQHAESFTA